MPEYELGRDSVGEERCGSIEESSYNETGRSGSGEGARVFSRYSAEQLSSVNKAILSIHVII